MAVTSSDFDSLIRTSANALFWSTFNTSIAQYDAFTQTLPTEDDIVKLYWMGQVPKVREWKDERKPTGLRKSNYSIEVKRYETSIEVDSKAFKSDHKLKLTENRLKDMASEMKAAPNEHLFSILEAGTTGDCHDGKKFFAANHTEGKSGTQSNLLTGTGIDTVAHFKADLLAAKIAMSRFKDDQGRVMNIVGDTLIVPTEAWDVAMESIKATTVEAGGANIWAGTHSLITSSYLADTKDWYYLCTVRAMKPLVLVWREGPNFETLGPGSDRYFFEKVWVFGSDAEYQGGYGLWYYAIKIDNT